MRRLMIFADNDINGTGQRAADVLAGRARHAGLAVRVLIPTDPGTDWADVWSQQDREVA